MSNKYLVNSVYFRNVLNTFTLMFRRTCLIIYILYKYKGKDKKTKNMQHN